MTGTTFDLSAVPQDLKDRPQWVCWRGIQEGARFKKLPYDPHHTASPKPAEASNPATWGTLDEALEAFPLLLPSWEKSPDFRGGGIGYEFDEHDPYCGLDFDKCRNSDTGELEPWAEHLVTRFQSYTEVSPSGTGVKIWIQGKLPGASRNIRPHIECYDHGRFFTVTAQPLPGTPTTISNQQALLNDFYPVLDILGTCLKRTGPARERFSLLFAGRWHDAHDTKGNPYGSQSEADLAYANIVTNAGADETQLDILWRLSGLWRDKAEKPSYQRSTSTKAQRPYQKPTQNHPRGERGNPSAAEDARQRQNGHAPAAEDEPSWPLPYGDTFNAKRLVLYFGENLHYCFPWKSWLVWTGTHWRRDTSGAVMRLAKATIKRLARELEDLDDKKEIAQLLAHIKASLAAGKLKAMMELAQSEEGIPLQPEDLDADRWLLNLANGTLDLQAGTLHPHRQADLLTKCLPIEYHADASCPTWERFLWHIMGGIQEEDSPDMPAGELENRRLADERAQRLITFLQRAIGYSLTGDTREQCLFVLHGSGSNGKTTFIETLQALLEDYAQSTPSASLLAKDPHRHEGIPNDIARLRGARLVTAVEIGEGKRLNEELVKRLTGQDTLTARFLFAEFFNFKAEFKLFIACNHLPEIRGTDHAIWRRIKCVPFTVTIPDKDQDKNLPGKLRVELPGILRWAVQGCLDWQQEGLVTPEEVIAATQRYRESQDVIEGFLTTECFRLPSAHVKASDLYEAYERWCKANEVDPLSKRAFGLKLQESGFTPDKGTGGTRIWKGIGLPSKEQEDKRSGA